MREQIRLWFYSQLFMSVVLTGRAPYRQVLGYEKMLDESGREMHKSWGNAIEAGEAFERMGADVMRWQYCAQPPDRNLLFGFGAGARDPAQAADALELGQVLRRLREHRGVPAGVGRRCREPSELRPLDRWLARPDARARPRGDGGVRGVPHRRRRSAPTRRSSTISRTGTSAARGGGSGTATASRCTCSGSRSSSPCASSRR